MAGIALSRLGVDAGWQRRGLATRLGLDALGVAWRLAPGLGTRVIVAHAPGRALFCQRFGFRPFESLPDWLYLPVKDVEATLARR
jgi:hypothetical protein